MRHTTRRVVTAAALGATLIVAGLGFLLVPTSGADTTTTSTTPAADLGGYTVVASGSAATVSYDQPNLPIPADPTLELDEGYTTATDNFGPVGDAVASVLYPGQVIANAGPELSILVPEAPLPPAPVWPVEAVTEFPAGPDNSSNDQPYVTMETSGSPNGTLATAAFGNTTESGPSQATGASTTGSSGVNPLPDVSSLIALQGLSSTSGSTTTATDAIASAASAVTGVSLLGGLVSIGAINSTATADSNGTSVNFTGSTAVTNFSLAGVPGTLTNSGIDVDTESPIKATLFTTVEKALTTLGVTVALTKDVDTVNGASGERRLDGVQITINLTTLDKYANQFADLLPETLLAKLPVAVPDKQIIVLDLGWVDVASAASPSFVDSDNFGSGSSLDTSPIGSGSFDGTSLGGVLGSGSATGDTFGSGTTPSISTPISTTPTTAGTGASAVGPIATAGSSVPFTGIGAGLIALGILGALALMLASTKLNGLTEGVAAGAACEGPTGIGLTPDDEMTELFAEAPGASRGGGE